MKKAFLIAMGFLTLLLGAIGVFFPIMPTTPFVLVAAACFGSSSPKLYEKLLGNKYFGEFIKNYRDKTGISKSVKTRALIFLWGTLLLSAVVMQGVVVCTILLAVGIGVTTHILLIHERK